MPAFAGTIPPEDLDALVAFLQTLRYPERGQASAQTPE
jgi:mono/diheme cytochrome c family protein